MKGCRPLTEEEVAELENAFSGAYANRDNALFLLGIKAGFRISEILSLRIADVWCFGQIADRVTVQRRYMKNKLEGRTVILHSEVKLALEKWIAELQTKTTINPELFLFQSRKGKNCSISRNQAWRILKRAFADKGLSGKLGTHSMRKTFADRVHEKLGKNIFLTQKALFHRNVNSTVSYLSFKNEEIEQAILSL